jgi:S-methylmethionine-dependent homocysteine/selenocysteine methylase
MMGYRQRLPQLGDDFFLTDGGIETTLIFLERLDLPDFAVFDLLKRTDGEAALRRYFRAYAALAERFGTGLILESPTWRARPTGGRDSATARARSPKRTDGRSGSSSKFAASFAAIPSPS